MKKIRVLIVAKPWQGGLYQYYLNAFRRNVKVEANLIYSYPKDISEYIAYKIDKKKWYQLQIEAINKSNYDFGFFINHSTYFAKLKNKSKNFLYLTDSANLSLDDQKIYSGIYISDIFYKNRIRENLFIDELPFGFDLQIHKKIESSPKKRLMCSLINRDKKRDAWLDKLDKKYFPHIYGNYFLKHKLFLKKPSNFHPQVNFLKQKFIYANYLISLNLHSNVLKQGTNQRTFEAAGCEIAQLIEYTPGLERFFDLKKEICIFRTHEEFYAKYDKLKHDHNYRLKLVNNSYKRAISEHTYDKRIDFILNHF